jgi:hypothetical protein
LSSSLTGASRKTRYCPRFAIHGFQTDFIFFACLASPGLVIVGWSVIGYFASADANIGTNGRIGYLALCPISA